VHCPSKPLTSLTGDSDTRRRDRADPRRSLCAYLLIGFLFSSMYTATDLLGSARLFGKPVDANDYSYFSFVTLTTTGYGDFTPVTSLGQRVAVIE